MTNNSESTRFYSVKQEEYVAELIGGQRIANSGAGHWNKGDVVQKDASLLIEAKTVVAPKGSISLKKEWFIKNKKEALEQRLSNYCVVVNFEPNGSNYFIIDERLMKFLVEKLIEENK